MIERKYIEFQRYTYIKFDQRTGVLEEQIEHFYRINDKLNTLFHVKNVAGANAELAGTYMLDARKCYIAGLLHDISAVMRPEDMLGHAQSIGIQLDESEKRYPFLLHQQMSALLAKSVFGIVDSDILSAIECHTTLKSNPSQYDMTLFIADKLFWDQSGTAPYFDSVQCAFIKIT